VIDARPAVRLGIDLGGTKIAGIAIDAAGRTLAEARRPAPRGDYGATLGCLVDLVTALEQGAGVTGAPVGIGIPGSLSPLTGRVQNANSTWLNGRSLAQDLAERLGDRVRFANDANCFALSEAIDGSAAGFHRVLGVILGTGCGSGIVVGHRIMDGPRGIGGEWGHNPLPWARAEEWPGPECWCGRRGCMETWVSGPALAADHQRVNAVPPMRRQSRAEPWKVMRLRARRWPVTPTDWRGVLRPSSTSLIRMSSCWGAACPSSPICTPTCQP
jgi:fructokinase